MSWHEVIKSWGGYAGLIAGLTAWLGNFFMYRTLQKEKASQDKQLELFRTSLESIKAHNNKFTSVQFEAYNTLWCALVDLNTCADDLWDSASHENLITFNESLRKASTLIQKSRVFLEDQHYRQLREIMSVFSNYKSGKQKLFSIRSENDLQDKSMDKLRRELDQIENNSFFRSSYKSLLDQIADSLKTQLGLKARP